MKLSVKLFFVFSLFMSLLSTGCHKSGEESSQDDNIITSEKLAGTYKVTAVTFLSASGIQQDLFSTLDDCDKASKQVFNPDHTYQFIDACTPPRDLISAWALIGSEKIVINSIEADIVSFDGHKLIISITDSAGLGGKLTEILTRQN